MVTQTKLHKYTGVMLATTCVAIGAASDVAISFEPAIPNIYLRALWFAAAVVTLLSLRAQAFLPVVVSMLVFLFSLRTAAFVFLVISGRVDLTGAVAERLAMIALIISWGISTKVIAPWKN